VTHSSGRIAPGAGSTGTLHIAGNYTQGRSGMLVLDIAARTHDVLAVAGTASLKGHGARAQRRLPSARRRDVHGAGHWAPGHTSTRLTLVWRSRAHTHC
jgi:hypothetical protein